MYTFDDQSVIEGDAVSISCMASGLPEPSYIFRKVSLFSLVDILITSLTNKSPVLHPPPSKKRKINLFYFKILVQWFWKIIYDYITPYYT